jgi:hypothetical protein
MTELREVIVVVACVSDRGQVNLAKVVGAVNRLRRVAGFVQRGQQHGRENRDDGDDDEEFDERKRGAFTLAICYS